MPLCLSRSAILSLHKFIVYILFELSIVQLRWIVFDWQSIATNQKLVEIPAQVLVTRSRCAKPGWKALFQKSKELTCLWPIYIHLAEHREGDAIPVLHKLLDVSIAS